MKCCENNKQGEGKGCPDIVHVLLLCLLLVEYVPCALMCNSSMSEVTNNLFQWPFVKLELLDSSYSVK